MTIIEPQPITPLAESLDHWIRTGDMPLMERLSELELALENAGWIRQIDLYNSNEFSLSGLKTIARLARTFFLKNPLIQRGVNVQTDYTFGRGITITAVDEDINAVIQAFLDDIKNQVELTSHQAMLQKDRELQLDGNIFLCFFVHELTGRIRVRSIPFQEIAHIICNPDDNKDPWFYKRVWQEYTDPADPSKGIEEKTMYYRDWQYSGDKTPTNNANEIAPDLVSVFHIKMGGFSDWKFGVPEVYAALDWARAYKMFLENWSTLMQAYARFALKISTKGGSSGVATAKARLNTGIGTTNAIDRNPPATAGSTWIEASDQVALDVVKTAGATTKAEEGRRLLLMVAAAQGLPETFYGDVSVGTLATAESLDRPTELKFSNRQEFWQSNLLRIVWFVIKNAVSAPSGALRGIGTMERNEYDEDQLVLNEGIEQEITIDFPEILSISIKDHIAAIISATTLDGKSLALHYTPRYVTQLLLTALGVDDVDQVIDTIYPNGADGTEPEYQPDPEPQPNTDPNQTQSKDAEPTTTLAKEIGKLAEALRNYE